MYILIDNLTKNAGKSHSMITLKRTTYMTFKIQFICLPVFNLNPQHSSISFEIGHAMYMLYTHIVTHNILQSES